MDEQERGERDGRVGAARDFTQGSVYQDAYKRGEAQRAYWQMAGDGLAATLNNLRNAPPATQGLLAGLALMAVVIHWVGARLFFTVFAALFACLPILLGAVVRSEMKNLTLGESLLGLVLKPVASRRSRAYVGVSVVFGVAFVALVNGMFDPEREARIAARRAAQAPSWPREADEGYIRVTLPANGSPALPTANVMTKERQPAEANPAPPTSAVRVGSPREPQALRAGPCRVEGHGILRWIESAHAEVVVGTTTTSVFACNPAEGIKWTHPLESHGIVQEVRALSDGGAIIAGITGNSCHLARLSSDGSELWAAAFGAGAQSRCVPTSVAVGGVGPLYVAGTGAQFEGQEAATLGKPFVAAIDSKGGLVWHTAVRPQLGDAWTLTASHASNPLVAPDGQGGAYVAFGTAIARLDSSAQMQWTALLKEVAGSALVDVVALGAASADGLYALGRLAAQGGSNPIYLLQVDPQGTLQRSVTWADRFEVLDGHGAEWRGRWLQPTASEGRSTIHVGASEIRVAGLYENNFTGGAHSAGTYPSAIVITFDKTLARAASEQFQLETGYTPIASLAALPGPQTGGILAMQEVGTGRAILAELGAPP